MKTIYRTCLLLMLAIAMQHSAMAQNTDANLLRFINLHRNKGLDNAMAGISNSAYPVAVAVPVAELAFGFIDRRMKMREIGLETAEMAIANLIIVTGLKYGINRTRPYDVYPELQPYSRDSDPSCPSGTTSFAFNTATALSMHYQRWYVTAPAFAWAATVGYSRIHLGEHYPTDVFWGAVVGVGSAWLVQKGNAWLRHRHNQYLMVEP